MKIRGIQSAEHAAADILLEKLGGKRQHLGRQAVVLRQQVNYQSVLEVVAIENGEVVGTGSLQQILVGQSVGLMVGPIVEKDGRLKPLLDELLDRALRTGYRFVLWEQTGQIDPSEFGFKKSSPGKIFFDTEQTQTDLYVYPLVPDGLNEISGKIEMNEN
ncbi:hypothetical protein LFYK43_04370 [Ligilactobacillus salitolerans]|uniref:N-acetyltransferase domain-containing protein n=1 Tax=Ligilactobacillus salitolerans TaxID=1808352 RepID=A0A401IR17_9LACO|nr:GNAT family acetyltransferase [Ligilactobacillus salitolerans]GBG93978.1 hypothetical protein LFYK43_04370 [Ligilactobacillus salitolerans]